MTAAEMMLALSIAVHPELADAIDRVCGESISCRADAVTTCWIETRCQTHHCGRNGCGPYQQLARYADDVDELVSMTLDERRQALVSDPELATRQWLAVMTRYEKRWGDRWPWRYNGSEHAERYQQRWQMIRLRLHRAVQRTQGE